MYHNKNKVLKKYNFIIIFTILISIFFLIPSLSAQYYNRSYYFKGLPSVYTPIFFPSNQYIPWGIDPPYNIWGYRGYNPWEFTIG